MRSVCTKRNMPTMVVPPLINAILTANIQLAARTSGATRSQSRTRDFFNEGFALCGKSLLVLYTKSTEEFYIHLINPIIPVR